ncbi:hypothetical protein CAPTEDRAFT_185614 [Capitella teleta]|uniref:Uncharacterized protein n=1 Tax=Capitella teleta TaxID=283909 RepID=R7V8I5_CAPTE|nr:hypothetical protein CAPTEDRAFT_185614 [Capitella teleta]|eukprot:ELU12656.1 hypothetical protein CAPTEDRAFT_185614 [Capitella teleta]
MTRNRPYNDTKSSVSMTRNVYLYIERIGCPKYVVNMHNIAQKSSSSSDFGQTRPTKAMHVAETIQSAQTQSTLFEDYMTSHTPSSMYLTPTSEIETDKSNACSRNRPERTSTIDSF